jgi:hypothetical protein
MATMQVLHTRAGDTIQQLFLSGERCAPMHARAWC